MKQFYTLGIVYLLFNTVAFAQSKLRMQVQTDHESGSTTRVDGKDFYLTGGAKGNVIKWDKRTGKVLWVIKAQQYAVREILLFKDGTFILKRQVKQWDAKTGKLIKDYRVLGKRLLLNRKRDKLYVHTTNRSFQKTIIAIDLKKRAKISFGNRANETDSGLERIRFSRNQQYIYYKSAKDGLSVWDKETAKRVAGNIKINLASRYIYLPKEKLVYVVDLEKRVGGGPRSWAHVLRKWNAKTNKMIKEYPYKSRIQSLVTFEALPFFVVLLKKKVEFRNKKTTQLIQTIDIAQVKKAYITPDKKQLIFKGDRRTSWVYDLAKKQITQTLDKSDSKSLKVLVINEVEAIVGTSREIAKANEAKRKKPAKAQPKVAEALNQEVHWDARGKALYFKNETEVVKWYMKYNRWISLPRRDNFVMQQFNKKPLSERKGLRLPKIMTLPDQQQLVVEEIKTGSQKYKQVSLWDVATRTKIHTYEGFQSKLVTPQVTQNKELLLTTSQEVLYYPTLTSTQPKHRFPAKGRQSCTILPGEKEILVYDHELYRTNDYTVRHYSLKTGQLIRKYPIDGGRRHRIYEIKLLPWTDQFMAVYRKGAIRKWNYRTGENLTPANFKFVGRRMEFLPDNKTLMNTRNLCFWNIETGQKIYDLRNFTRKAIASAILPDKEHVILVYGARMRRSKVARMLMIKFNYKTGKVAFNIKKNNLDNYPKKVILLPDRQTFLTVQNNGLIAHWDLKNGQRLKSYENRFGAPKGYQFNKDTTQLITTHQLGAVSLWDLSSRKEMVSAIVRSADDYVVVSPKGYYASTKRSVQNLHYVQNNQILLFDQLDLIFNRPDKVLQATGLASKKTLKRYRQAAKKRLRGFGIKEELIKKLMESDFDEQYDYPEIFRKGKGMNLKVIPTNKSEYKVKVAIRDKKGKLDRYNVYVNGVPLYGKNGQDLRSRNIQQLEQNLKIPLSRGKNNIEITALNNQGVSAIKEKFQVIFTPKKTLPKPTLHLVAIGVSQYKNENYRLNFARKDAQDMIAAFTQNNSGLFKEVKTYPLYDKDLSMKQLALVKKQLLNTKVDDYVVVFYAGHGLLDAKQDYFLGTYAVNFENPQEGGLPYQQLENLMDGIPARQKLLMVDACHSGEVDKDNYEELAVNTDDNKVTFRGFSKVKKSLKQTTQKTRSIGLSNSYQLMKEIFTDLRKGTGATILSSAGGGEFALESAEWNNGVFTYSVLSGLKSKKADQNKDGKIMLSELQTYLYNQVQKLTKGKQHPTSRIKNVSNDFRIW
ncbi:MAG TPA: hypothetical protein DCS93_13945 [Microscillaceae bacterium]|nr:hypothetical protein [Microscillaceae bacterium]